MCPRRPAVLPANQIKKPHPVDPDGAPLPCAAPPWRRCNDGHNIEKPTRGTLPAGFIAETPGHAVVSASCYGISTSRARAKITTQHKRCAFSAPWKSPSNFRSHLPETLACILCRQVTQGWADLPYRGEDGSSSVNPSHSGCMPPSARYNWYGDRDFPPGHYAPARKGDRR